VNNYFLNVGIYVGTLDQKPHIFFIVNANESLGGNQLILHGLSPIYLIPISIIVAIFVAIAKRSSRYAAPSSDSAY
jgi:hypothetical protein